MTEILQPASKVSSDEAWTLVPTKLLSSSKLVSPLSLRRRTSNSFAQRVMLHSKDWLRPFPCWKGAWVLESLSVEICQKYSAELLGPMEYNTPRLRGFTPWTQTLHIEINFADQKPNALVDTLTALSIVWPQQCTQCTSICCALLSCSGVSLRVGFMSSLCSPCPLSLPIYLITSPLISLDKQIGFQSAPFPLVISRPVFKRRGGACYWLNQTSSELFLLVSVTALINIWRHNCYRVFKPITHSWWASGDYKEIWRWHDEIKERVSLSWIIFLVNCEWEYSTDSLWWDTNNIKVKSSFQTIYMCESML